MNVRATGTITDSTVMGGRIPQLAFDATTADDAAHVTANGSFADFNPAVASGRTAMDGQVAGTLRADATIQNVSAGVTPDSIAGTAKLSLQPSTVGGLAIDSAALDADYRNQTGDIRQLQVVGRDVNVFFRLCDLYAGMDPSVAEVLSDAWRIPVRAARPAHQPVFAENGERRRPAPESAKPAAAPAEIPNRSAG